MNAWIMLFSYTRIIVMFLKFTPIISSCFSLLPLTISQRVFFNFHVMHIFFYIFILKVFKIGVEGGIQKLRFHYGISTLL